MDGRSRRGACCDSDHYLVIGKIRQRIALINKNINARQIKWNVDKLIECEDTKNRYANAISATLHTIYNELEVEGLWDNIKCSIIESAKETVGTKQKQQNEWYDLDCKIANERKKESRKKYLDRCTRQNLLDYQEKRKHAKMIIRKKKKEHLNRQVEQIETDFRNKNVRKMYQAIKQQTKPFYPRTNNCKNKSGEMISDKQGILQRWKEHFNETLNMQNEENVNKELQTAEIQISDPSFAETKTAIAKLKNHKCNGADGIAAELLKYDGEELHTQLHSLMVKIWRNNSMPIEWLSSLIIPIHKKGDKANCCNYRGISILNAAYKTFTNILYEKVREYSEQILDDYQAGFRANWSTIDQGFIATQTFEKLYEYDIDVYCLFVDFKQAFDSIDRRHIKFLLQSIGIPLKLIELSIMTLTNTTAKVIVQGECSESFPIISGVKQGDALSTLIFNLVLHAAITELNPNGTLYNKPFQLCAYADDILIMAKSRSELQSAFKKLEKKVRTTGLRINTEKTKFMVRSSSGLRHDDLLIGDYAFENVQEFTYLGIKISANKDMSLTINDRVLAANKCYYSNLKLLKSKLLSRDQKLRIYKTLIRPVLTYGCELWTLKTTDINQLMVFERKILRKIYGPIRLQDGTYRIRYNHELELLAKHETVIRFIKSQRIRWLGHVFRMPKERTTRKAVELRPVGGRRRGRPRKRWLEDVEDDLAKLNVRRWKEVALDRDGWRKVVNEAMVHQGL